MTHPPSRTRIKYCGITQLSDALEAVRLGVDALGFVFYPPSPRNIDIEQAADIIRQLPAFVSCVGLFVDASEEFIQQVLQSTTIDTLQFHGNETLEQCQRYGKPYLKAVRMKPDVDLVAVAAHYNTAAALLLDTYEKGLPGGTGTSFDWARVPETLAKPVILAGGLSVGNVTEAIQTVKPYAVDVSGGIEQSKGIKDAAKMAAFINAVNHA